MQFFKKLVPCLLAALILLGCGAQSDGSATEAPMTDITLTKDLVIVVDSKAGDTVQQAALLMQTYIDAKMNIARPKIVSEDPGKNAMIVAVDDTMEAGKYTFATKGSSLYITASDAHTLLYAVKQLRFAMVAGGNSTTITAQMCQELCGALDVSNMPFTFVGQNILFKNIEGGNTVLDRAPRYQKLILEYQPDILAIQENSADWVYYNRTYFKSTYFEVETNGCTILLRKDRYELIKNGDFWLSPTPNIKSQFEGDSGPRYSMWAVIKDKLTGKEIFISNSHLDWNNDTQRALQLEVLIEQNAERFEQYPTIVCGDYNSQPDGPIYARITEFFADASKTAAKNISTIDYTCHSFGASATFIDYILHSEDFSVNLYYIMNDMYGGDVSDHYGVLAEMQFAN